jgi:hypothetical protein
VANHRGKYYLFATLPRYRGKRGKPWQTVCHGVKWLKHKDLDSGVATVAKKFISGGGSSHEVQQLWW